MAIPKAVSVKDKVLETAVGRFQWPKDAELYYLPLERELLPDKARRLMFQAYLRFAGLAYTDHPAINADYMSPSGQSPFLVLQFGPKPIIFHDLFQLIEFLDSQKLGIDRDLDKREQAHCQAFISLVKTMLIAMNYETWVSPLSLKHTLTKYAYGLPWPLRQIVPYARYVCYCWDHWDLYWQREEIVLERFEEACKALSIHLGGNDTFYQSGPTTLDAIVYGCTEAILTFQPKTKLADILMLYPNLGRFCQSAVQSQRKGLQFITSPSNVNLASLDK